MSTMSVPETRVCDVQMVDIGSADIDDTRLGFEQFFRDEYPGLVALASAVLGDRSVAEDIAAETMGRAFRRWEQISGYDKPGAWTRRVAINLIHSRRRRVASELRTLLRLGRATATAAVAPDRADADHFERLLAPLAPRQRTVAALHYLDDLPVAEIAELMGCAEGTVKSQLHDARAAIATALSTPANPNEASHEPTIR